METLSHSEYHKTKSDHEPAPYHEEEVLRALVDGEGIIRNFIDPELANRIGENLSVLIPREDTVGIPVTTDPDYEPDEYDLPLSDQIKEEIRRAEMLFAALLSTAAGITEDMLPEMSTEAIKYLGDEGMNWHFDNYNIVDTNPDPKLKDIGVLNGVLTLKGTAIYFYKDPDTQEVHRFKVGPGTLVITRSGDIDDLSQVEHAVSAPQGDDKERVALLMTLNKYLPQ